MNKETKNCQNCKNDFAIEPEDFDFYKKIDVPPPTFCPDCRLQRRLVWRNERTLYRRKCSAPGHAEDLISYIAPEKPQPVYDQQYWWSDDWDPLTYGRDYDFSKHFFTQFKELLDTVPRSSLSSAYSTMINSEYSNWAGDLKNCYLVTDADYVEDSGYSSTIFKSKDCYECNAVSESELCYESFNLLKCYRTVGSINCQGCSDVWFSKNCNGCANCFGCVNLRNKSHCIFNEQYSKEEYLKKISEFHGESKKAYDLLKKRAQEFWASLPEKHSRGYGNVNVSGDYIYHSKNTKNGFLVSDVEDSKYVSLIHSLNTKDCFDYTDWGENARLLYECIACGLGASNLKFCNLVVIQTKDSSYSYFSYNCSNIFGCVNMRKKQYCILNKQYTKEEYESLLPKIIEHMNSMPYVDKSGRVYKYGEFFPTEISPFSYNESVAQEFFPITKEEAGQKGYSWRDPDSKNYTATKTTVEIPETIDGVDDSITKEVIECEHSATPAGGCNQSCTTAFRIIPAELQFYRKMKLPLPHLCPNCRHYERLKYRNPLRLWKRVCMCKGKESANDIYKNTTSHSHGENQCPNEFETSFSPERPEIVYCEGCYNAEVV
ncbi:MAG: hypothetical protein AAB536_00710 [Patescibacteria group bacterium]